MPLWSERIPLHASSTPIVPVRSVMRLPCRIASTPHQCKTSKTAIVFFCINQPMIAFSAFRGHGTAIRKKTTGKRKCRTQAGPPIHLRRVSVKPIAQKAPSTPRTRHSGLASKNKVSKASPNPKPANSAIAPFASWGTGAGWSFQRIWKSAMQRIGTKKP